MTRSHRWYDHETSFFTSDETCNSIAAKTADSRLECRRQIEDIEQQQRWTCDFFFSSSNLILLLRPTEPRRAIEQHRSSLFCRAREASTLKKKRLPTIITSFDRRAHIANYDVRCDDKNQIRLSFWAIILIVSSFLLFFFYRRASPIDHLADHQCPSCWIRWLESTKRAQSKCKVKSSTN